MNSALRSVSAPMEHVPTPIDEYLARQREMSAVERFAARLPSSDGDVVSARWLERLPITDPKPGQQYAFEVDLDACTGCKACVTACNSLNGLDAGEPWRRVGTLHGTDEAGRAVLQTVTHACHHCIEPACLDGCPANAYEKDPVTGIVRHLDDACIGCSYCTLTCPYDVPAYNPALGIVRKCDMCADRLAVGEAPACVQGCPQGAIAITLVEVADVAVSCVEPGTTLVPGAPASSTTKPTTRYRSQVALPHDLVSADHRAVHPSPGHTPLAVMLVLTQAAVGTFVVGSWLRVMVGVGTAETVTLSMLGLVTGVVALAASVFHLGRPMLAWRAVLGVQHSWLSREIVAFSVFALAAVADTVLLVAGAPDRGTHVALALAVASGLGGVACSVQVYAVTGRRWWRWSTTGPRFAATMALGGALGTAFALTLTRTSAFVEHLRVLMMVGVVAVLVGVLVPLVAVRPRGRDRLGSAELRGSAELLRGPLRARLLARVALGGVGAVVLPAVAIADLAGDGLSYRSAVLFALAAVVAMIGEYHERRLFFLASSPPRLPAPMR